MTELDQTTIRRRLAVIARDVALLEPEAGIPWSEYRTNGVRNRLVHAYDDLDDARVHASIASAVALLPQFAAAVGRYLGDD